jgi:AraC-like DNA-binding protein
LIGECGRRHWNCAELLDQVRKDIVLELLEIGDHVIGNSAHVAAYSSASSITRAVRRWTGDSPRTQFAQEMAKT